MIAAAAAPEQSLSGEQRVALAVRLTRAAWSMSGRALPSYERSEIPVRVIRPS